MVVVVVVRVVVPVHPALSAPPQSQYNPYAVPNNVQNMQQQFNPYAVPNNVQNML